MAVYNVLTKNDIDFTDVPRAQIDCYKWSEGYAPKAFGQLIYIKNKGFALKMTAYEQAPKAVYTEYNQPVYEDSCLEFFVRFNKDNPLYMNLEMNSNGAFLASVRVERKNKTNIHNLIDLPAIKADIFDEFWTVETFFTLEQIEAMFGKINLKKGYVFYGNFYKCGDKTAKPHYGMWSLIKTDKPDFHRPEYFGKLVIA